MAGLKAFLYGLAPILGMSGAALYERQRVLTTLGVLEAAQGRGPGSGVPLTAENAAAVIISILAAEALSDVNERVAALCNAVPEAVSKGGNLGQWRRYGGPTFKSEVGRVLLGEPTAWPGGGAGTLVHTIRVSRVWRGQLVKSPSGAQPLTFIPPIISMPGVGRVRPEIGPISLTAEIESETLERVANFTRGALTQLEEGDEE
jgi:hypothetical protein